jgi:hypothetical protein
VRKYLEGVALRVTGTVLLPLGDPSTQRSMNRVVAQQELERQNFRVRGSGGDAVFWPTASWLRPPLPVTVRLTQGIMTPLTPFIIFNSILERGRKVLA